MRAASRSPGFEAFYDEAPGGERQVGSLYGIHWRGSGRESLVAVFRDSGTYGPDGAERSQEITLGSLAHRRDLAAAMGWGFFLAAEGRSPMTRLGQAGYLRPFFAFLDEQDPGGGIVSLTQVDTSLVNRFIVWLSQQVVTSRDGSSKPMPKDYKARYYNQLRSIVEALRRDGRHQVAGDCSFRKNPWPTPKGGGAGNSLPNPERVLPDSQLRAIHEACRQEIHELLARFATGERLLAEFGDQGDADGNGLDLGKLGGLLTAVQRRYGGVMPGMGWLRAHDRCIYDAVRRHGGRGEVLPYLVATPATLLPFVLLLLMRTFFNPDALLTIRDSFCREAHWLWGSRDWELMSGRLSTEGEEELSRLVSGGLSGDAATRVVLSSYKGRKNGMVTRTFRASSEWDSPPQLITEVRRLTGRLRPGVSPAWRDRLFLFQVPSCTSSEPRSFMSNWGPSGDGVLPTALGRFSKRHGLARIVLRSFRLAGADVVWEATRGDPTAVATMLGNQPATASSHYGTPGNVLRAEQTLAVMTNRRVRMVETGGRSRIEYTACTPGFHCAAPYDSPVPGQAGGRLCSAYPMCATCPLASLDRSRPEAVAWLLHLAEGIEDSRGTMDQARYRAVYAPLLLALRETWLDGVPDAVMREAEAMAANLPLPAGME